MTSHDLKIWLTTNKMTQKQLADRLGLTSNTISAYCTGTPPKWLKYALVGLEIELQQTNKDQLL